MPDNFSCRHEIAVLMCVQEPYPVMVFAPAQKLSDIVRLYACVNKAFVTTQMGRLNARM